MVKFAVYVVESRPIAAFGTQGERVTEARFRIQSSGGDCCDYKGSGHGADFNNRCESLKRAATMVEAPEPSGHDLERWKQDVVQRALSQIKA